MKKPIPNQAFILAAGMGSRLRPYTDDRPKPMVEIMDKPLLGHIIDHLKADDITDITINTHYRGQQIADYAKTRSDVQITLSPEEELLNTGGGIKKQISHFNGPFFAINGDAYWENPTDGPSIFSQLAAQWDAGKMDILLALQPVQRMALTQGVGDYNWLPDGRIIRSLDQKGAYMFTSIRLQHPRIFEDTASGAFSYLDCMDKAQSQGRLYGMIFDGDWHHISTPADLDAVREAAAHKAQAG